MKKSPSPARGRPGSSTGAAAKPKAGVASAASKAGGSRPGSAAPSKKTGGGAMGAIGAYTKLKAVGKGSFGQIWLVRHTAKGGEAVVLKEVNTKKISANEVKAQRQEIEVLQKAKHENIVGFVGTFEEAGTIALLMEYAPRGDLGSAIAKRISDGRVKFPESEMKKVAAQLAAALTYLHEELKVIHRDVKPANILVTNDADVKLADFGLCAYLTQTLSGEPVGTPLYMSPELCAGKPYDCGADAWALGCTCFEAMALQSPWSELDDGFGGLQGGMKGLLKTLNTSSLDFASLKVANGGNFSPELCDAAAALLHKDPAKRMQLRKLTDQLTERPAIPASWGLSAEAQAALAAGS